MDVYIVILLWKRPSDKQLDPSSRLAKQNTFVPVD